MLQFNKSLATNTNAMYLDTVNTGSGYYDTLAFVYSQSYDNSNGTFNVSVTSTPNQYNHWIVVQNTGSLVPSYTGQYDFGLWKVELAPAIWQSVATAWDSYDEIWDAAGDDVLDTLLYSDRAFVSGSNNSSITEYVSSNENGTYTTYNG